MRTRTRLALAGVCLLMAATVARAQTVDRYSVPIKVTLSGASRTITLVSTGKRVELEQISVQPIGTGSISVALERDCASVTTTSPVTAKTPINPESAPANRPLVAVYDVSAAGGCTVISPDWVIPDGGLLGIPAAKVYAEAANKNINIRITPGSGGTLAGTLRLQVTFTEAR